MIVSLRYSLIVGGGAPASEDLLPSLRVVRKKCWNGWNSFYSAVRRISVTWRQQFGSIDKFRSTRQNETLQIGDIKINMLGKWYFSYIFCTSSLWCLLVSFKIDEHIQVLLHQILNLFNLTQTSSLQCCKTIIFPLFVHSKQYFILSIMFSASVLYLILRSGLSAQQL